MTKQEHQAALSARRVQQRDDSAQVQQPHPPEVRGSDRVAVSFQAASVSPPSPDTYTELVKLLIEKVELRVAELRRELLEHRSADSRGQFNQRKAALQAARRHVAIASQASPGRTYPPSERIADEVKVAEFLMGQGSDR